MANIYSPATLNTLIERINRLSPETKPLWGKMNVSQMMAHCSEVLLVGLGEKTLKSNLFTKLFKGYIKKLILSDKPYKQSTPTHPSYVISDAKDFNKEKSQLIDLVSKFSKEGPDAAEKRVHPILGKLTAEEWSTAMYKHLDHHLTQFGV